MLYIFPRSDEDNDPFCGIGLGDRVSDTLTGFTGIVTARVEYLTGCAQLSILPRSDEDNDVKAALWFDIERIEKLPGDAVTIKSRRGGADIAPPPAQGRQFPA